MSDWSCGEGCECNERLGRFQQVLGDESMRWTPAQIQAVESVIYCALLCVERHCPDPITKLYASCQLLNPRWDAQRAMEVQR
jgi:hypothetical protein